MDYIVRTEAGYDVYLRGVHVADVSTLAEARRLAPGARVVAAAAWTMQP